MGRDLGGALPYRVGESTPVRAEPGGTLALLLFALCCAAASAWSINPYRYGLADHALTLPFLAQWIDPSLYPGDSIVAERLHLYSIFWPGLAWILRAVPLSLPGLFFGLYVAALTATFWAIGALAKQMHGTPAAGFLAMFLLVFPKPGLAGSWTIEDTLLTRVVALPVVLLALVYVLRTRHLAAWALLGLAFVLHPLTAVYGLVMITPAVFYDLRSRPLEVLLGVLVFALAAAPLVVWAARMAPPSPVLADAAWMGVLRLRSPNHVAPTTWGIDEYVAMGLVVAVLLAMLPSGRPTRSTFVLLSAAGAIVLACAAGFVFTEIVPVTPVVQFQPFRSSALLVFLAAVALAARLADAVRGRLLAGETAACVLAAAVLYLRVDAWPFAVVAVAMVAAFAATYARVSGRAPGSALLGLFLALMLIGLASGASLAGKSMKISNGQPKDWLAAQQWAREHTPVDAWFIVPPGQMGFRVESQRAIYGDWKDGTQAFFNPAIGDEWMKRMRRLGFDESLKVHGFTGLERLDAAFDELPAQSLGQLAAELGAGGRPVFLVERSEARRFPGAVYENDVYAIVRLAPAGAAAMPPTDD